MRKAMIEAEDLVRRGEEYYEKHLRAKLYPKHKGKYVYLDPDTGDYEMDEDDLAAMQRATAKYPGRVFYILRVGYRSSVSFCGADDGEEDADCPHGHAKRPTHHSSARSRTGRRHPQAAEGGTTMREATLDPEELGRRGQEYYDKFLRAKLFPDHKGEFVVLDPDTGDYEIDEDEVAAVDRAMAKHPDTLFYILRVGYRTADSFGGDDGEEEG